MSRSDPIKADVRRVRRKSKLGADAACVLCGHAQLAALTAVRRTLLEDHHVAGHANDSTLTVPLCRNCHAEVTERLREANVSMTLPRSALDRLVAILRGLCEFLVLLIDTLRRGADELAALAAAQDRQFPSWRTLREAQ